MLLNTNARDYIEGIVNGDLVMLSKAITLAESSHEDHRVLSSTILDGIIQHSGNSFRLGVTGVPGVGKSSFIEKFGLKLLEQGYKLAVLAVDPSSSKSKGSILGDKTRMTELSAHPKVFIRPSPSGGMLGGLTRSTYESMLLCEAAGYDFIMIETVGVGQSEISVAGITDFFLLLMLSGAGDELQGIKRGIMEMADALVITKADGDNLEKAKLARSEYSHAMHLFRLAESGWTPRAMTCSSLTGAGIQEVYGMIEEYRKSARASGYFQMKRKQQQIQLFISALEEEIKRRVLKDPGVQKEIQNISEISQVQMIQPFESARKIIEDYFKNRK